MDQKIGHAVSDVIEESSDQESLSEFALHYVEYMLLKQEKKSILKAFSHLSNAIKAYLRFYQSQVVSGSWSVEFVDFLCRELKDLSYIAEKNFTASKEETKEIKESPLKVAKVTLETVFNKSQIIKESFPDSRKLAAFYAIIHI
jgi:aspartyl-tRNA synthetase